MNIFRGTIINSETKISELVLLNPYFLLLLEHLEIKIQLKEKTLSQICEEHNINEELFISISNLYFGNSCRLSFDCQSSIIQTIIKFLKNSHTYYIEEKYPRIRDYIKQMSKNEDFKEAVVLEDFFNKYFLEVKEHLDYENNTVFPYVIELEKLITKSFKELKVNDFSAAEYRDHHDDIEIKLTDLKNLLVKYIPQKEEQSIRRLLLLELFELEYSINIHSLIEEKILIPLVEKMERKLNK